MWVAAYWAADEKEGDSSHQGRVADERLQDDAQHPRHLQPSAQTPESDVHLRGGALWYNRRPLLSL